MLPASLLSLALLTLAGVLLDSHRREWAAARAGDDGPAFRFARGRVIRRTTATVAIALVGVQVALWPVVPREPLWIVLYTGSLASAAALIFSLGVTDAWASSRYYRAESRRRLAEHAEALTRVAREQRAKADSTADAEARHA